MIEAICKKCGAITKVKQIRVQDCPNCNGYDSLYGLHTQEGKRLKEYYERQSK